MPLPCRSTNFLVASLVASMACAACHTQADETSTLRALQSQWYQDFAARDVARLTAYHASDGVVADPHGLVTGTSAIQAMWQAAAADRSTTMRGDILRVEISESRDLAYILGRYITTEVASSTQRPAPTPRRTHGCHR